MDKKSVNIYIATSITGPRRADGVYMYLIETLVWRVKDGKREKVTVTRQQMTALSDTTENQMAVNALAAALERITAPCFLTIWTDCEYLYRTLENRQYEHWREHDWQNAKGKPVQHVDKWQRIQYLLNAHDFQAKLRERHGYTDWMAREIKKRAAVRGAS